MLAQAWAASGTSCGARRSACGGVRMSYRMFCILVTVVALGLLVLSNIAAKRERELRMKSLIAGSKRISSAIEYLQRQEFSRGVYRELRVERPENTASQEILFGVWKLVIEDMHEVHPSITPRLPLRYRIGCWIAGIEAR